jgi:putative molybdopterin biosynthesis protein
MMRERRSRFNSSGLWNEVKALGDREIFRTLVTIEEADAELRKHFKPEPTSTDQVALSGAMGRTLAQDVIAQIDVPGFDRATMDGYAVIADDTFGANDDDPKRLKIVGRCEAGQQISIPVNGGEAIEISTGAPVPRGSNAVVMVEHTRRINSTLEIFRPVVPGENISAAGSDIMAGELVLRKGETITPREVGVLAALGTDRITVFRKPRVAILSTGNELVSPAASLTYGKVYDINASATAASVVECGGEPVSLGIVPDNAEVMEKKLKQALQQGDMVLTSGSTSAGAGDLVYRIIDNLGKPGVLVHGISVKPGKPALVAVVDSKPLIGLPGHPTSALMIFHALVAPILREMSGLTRRAVVVLDAKLALRVTSAKGRRELLPVHLVRAATGEYLAYPTVGGSSAITSFSLSDGYIDIPDTVSFVEEGEQVRVHLFGAGLNPADLTVIGSHCIGIDVLIGVVRERRPEFAVKVINTGSLGGLHAVSRGEADIAGLHLLDEATGEYNVPFYHRFGLKEKAVLVRGYAREQGFLLPKGNPKGIDGFDALLLRDVTFMNRNRGSGTRILVDFYLSRIAASRGITLEELARRISGYTSEAKSHSAVAAAVAHGRADVGVGIRTVAETYGLDFIKIGDESFDFLVARDRIDKPAVQSFLGALGSKEFASLLTVKAPGLRPSPSTGTTLLA